MDQPLFLVVIVLAIVVLIFFQFRNGRKRQRDAAEMQQKLIPGAEVMTSHGIYGTLISLDDDKNEAVIETTPGTRLRLHRQTISRVVEPELAEAVEGHDETANARLDAATTDDVILEEPAYGERTTTEAEASQGTAPTDADAADPTRDGSVGPAAASDAAEPTAPKAPRGRKKAGE